MPCLFLNKQPFLVPELFSLSQSFGTLNGKTNQIYVYGNHFTKNSIVMMNDVVCFSFFNGSKQLGFLIPWKNITKGGVYKIQVVNPSNDYPMMINMNGVYNDPLTSNSLLFTVNS